MTANRRRELCSLINQEPWSMDNKTTHGTSLGVFNLSSTMFMVDNSVSNGIPFAVKESGL